MELPPEVYEFAEAVALIERDVFEQFVKTARGRGRSNADIAHALNAYANQWTRKRSLPRNPVGALLTLLQPEKRDRLNSGSWTIKKWVNGKRSKMRQEAQKTKERERVREWDALAAEFARLSVEERDRLLGEAKGWYRRNNPDSAILTAIQEAIRWNGKRPPKKGEYVGATLEGAGYVYALKASRGQYVAKA